VTDRLSEHFTREEFTCRDGCGFDAIDPRLVFALEILRRDMRCAVHILSGCRCLAHNRAVVGAKDSKHLSGIAADITVPGVPIRQVCQQAMRIPEFTGIGLDEQRHMLHLDVREDPARWVYLGGHAVAGWPVGLEA
jgi:uncharacterized protein YcbK (DUF882 family)